MTRKKVDPTTKLSKKVFARVSESFFEKMETWRSNSNCRTMAELTRKILYKEEIIWYHKDASLESVINELSGIRKELNAIGNNINQVTRFFNSASLPSEKWNEAARILAEYNKTGAKINALLSIIAGLSDKWSPK